jgi:drug/metabolite transporter (DMT)-like permease
MLLLATVFWGAGFTWAKVGGETINQARGLPNGSALGPLLLLAPRFVLAGLLWTGVFPRARSGWSRASVRRAVAMGTLLGAGMMVQHIGLESSGASIIAFLTSLGIVFVPIVSTFLFRKPPRPIAWLAVAVAAAGVWLMTGATPRGFGVGELLGVLCAVLFTFHLFTVNALVPRDDPFRMTGGQFFLVAAISGLAMLFIADGRALLAAPRDLLDVLTIRNVWLNGLLLVIFPTISFGLLTFYQPRLDPTRATLIYLFEPIAASIYAYLAAGERLIPVALLGAALILAANAIVELPGRRESGREPDLAPREQV